MTLSILFVDDEANLLSGLQRALRVRRDQWDMQFVGSAQEALDLMAAHAFDVIVSDMRMPGMDGASLLSEVERRYPSTLRIILSGYAEEQSVLRTVGPAHQYIAKPSDPSAILAIMDSTVALHQILASPRLRAGAARLRNLPTPPELYLKLVEATKTDNAASNVIAGLIAGDVAMTAELLKLTNSAFFGISSHIADPLQAVRLLGQETIRSLVLSVGIFKQFAGNTSIAPALRDLNQRGLRQAALARRLARDDGATVYRQEQVFCAAMLAPIGALVLLDADPALYLRFFTAAEQPGADAEREQFGATRAELGAYLLGLWGFGSEIIEAVLYQTEPSRCLRQEKSTLTYVHLAIGLGTASPAHASARLDSIDEAYARRVGLAERLPSWREINAAFPEA